MAPTLFSKFIPNILPRAVESELSEYAAQDQKLQRELIQNGFTRQVFFSFGDKICPFPQVSLAWLGRDAGVPRMADAVQESRLCFWESGVWKGWSWVLILWKLPFALVDFEDRAFLWVGSWAGHL